MENEQKPDRPNGSKESGPPFRLMAGIIVFILVMMGVVLAISGAVAS